MFQLLSTMFELYYIPIHVYKLPPQPFPQSTFRALTSTHTPHPHFCIFDIYHVFSRIFNYCQPLASPNTYSYTSTTVPSHLRDPTFISEPIYPSLTPYPHFQPFPRFLNHYNVFLRVHNVCWPSPSPWPGSQTLKSVFESNHLPFTHFHSFSPIFNIFSSF